MEGKSTWCGGFSCDEEVRLVVIEALVEETVIGISCWMRKKPSAKRKKKIGVMVLITDEGMGW